MLPANAPAWAHRIEARTRRAIDAIAQVRAELLQALALLAGWLMVTIGVVDLTAPIAWSFSVGVLLLSIVGWKFVGVLFWRGLYALTRGEDEQ